MKFGIQGEILNIFPFHFIFPGYGTNSFFLFLSICLYLDSEDEKRWFETSRPLMEMNAL